MRGAGGVGGGAGVEACWGWKLGEGGSGAGERGLSAGGLRGGGHWPRGAHASNDWVGGQAKGREWK